MAQAVGPGETGNVGPNGIRRVEGLGDSIGVTNERGFSGGSNRTVKVVTESDANNARAAARRLGRDLGLKQVGTDSNGQTYPIADSLEIGLADERLSSNVGEPADYLTYNAVAVINVLAVDNSDLRAVTQSQLVPSGEGVSLLPSSVEARPVLVRSFNAIDQKFDLDVLVSGSASRPIDEERVRSSIAGRAKADAERMLRSELPLRSVTIESTPDWITLPRLADRITVQVQP
jgi:hypothetical protein